MARKKEKSEDITVEVHNLPSVFVMETQMPKKMVKDLNTYLDELLKQDDRESLSGTLVGQIHRGEQLNMDPEHELFQEIVQISIEVFDHLLWHLRFHQKHRRQLMYLYLYVFRFLLLPSHD